MIYNFSEKKNQNDRLERELQLLKQEYQKPEMPEEQFKNLQQKMKEAVLEADKTKIRAGIAKFAAAAALIAGFIVLPNMSATAAYAMGQIPVIGHLAEAVTFRDYKYESDRNKADVRVPEIKVREQAENDKAEEKLERTAEEINAEIQEITDRLVKEFEENLAEDWGYQDISVDSRVVTETDDYFTLKLNCYQGAGSGYEFNYYYTIDLKTGERLQLKDIFEDGADYITPISRNIKKQMKQQMADDENIMYWLDNEIEEWNFKKITADTSFYLNEEGRVVISFNEGDVAPMYMGAVEFEIPENVLSSIRK